MIKSRRIFLIFSILSFFEKTFAVCDFGCEENDQCLVEYRFQGTVKPTSKCKYAMNLVSTRNYAELRSLMRGFDERSEILVCCVPISVVKCQSFGFRPPEPPMVRNHIIGGVEAKVGEFPYFAALGYLDNFEESYKFDCGGTLIAEQFVLTAAHCVNNFRRQPKLIRLGKTSFTDSFDDEVDPVDRSPLKIIPHPSYHPLSRDHDIALIKLNKPVKFDYYVFPACLAAPNQKPTELMINGLGTTHFSKDNAGWLQKGKIREVPLRDCQNKFLDAYGAAFLKSTIKLQNGISDNVICGKGQGVDTCQGDSGTGMIHIENGVHYVYGVTSFGIGCDSIFPGFYTRITNYLTWIESTVWA